MRECKVYVEQLLQKSGIKVAAGQLHYLDAFVKQDSVVELFIQIRNAQESMVNKWNEQIQIDEIMRTSIPLPNGMAGQAYEHVFDFAKLHAIGMDEYTVDIPENIGIHFLKAENKIAGSFKEGGEFSLYLNFRLKTEAGDKPFHVKEIKLFVNHDPRSLWRNLDSNKEDSYWKEDNLSKHADFDSLKLVMGSKRGRSHAHEGKFRDDAFNFAFDKVSGWGVIAVADGAGSAKYSRKGSEIACNAVIEYFKAMDSEAIATGESLIEKYLKDQGEDILKEINNIFIANLGSAALLAHNKIREEATQRKAELKDYATTLIFALIKKYNAKYLIASFWVGDGGIGIYNKHTKEIFTLGIPDSGEFAGQTKFITMSDIFYNGAYASRIKVKVVDDFTALVLMTDGITDAKFQTDNNLSRIEKWDEFWDDLQGQNSEKTQVDFAAPPNKVENQLMAWLDFWSPGNHDDRTLAILYTNYEQDSHHKDS